MNEMRIYKIVVVAVLLGTASVSLGAGDTWTQKAPLPTARALLSTSAVDGKIYAIGGRQTSGASASLAVEQYDPATDTWTTKAPMPTARQWLSTSAVNGKIYAFGGTPRTYEPALSTVEEYDPATDSWTEKAPMPTARFVFSTSVVDGKIYAIGGFLRATRGGAEPLSSAVEAYDPATDTWTEKAPMPTARGFLATSVVNGKIYAIGGAFSSASILSTVEEYDPTTDTWATKTSMPTRRSTVLAASALNGIIYVIGGVRGGTVLSTVEAYDPATDTWTTKTDMPRARGFLSTSAVNGKIYAIGGSLSSPWNGISMVEEYDPNPLVVDFNGDGVVDSADMCMMVDHWHTDNALYDIAPAPFGDGIVDIQDLIVLAEHLFEEVEVYDPTLVAHWPLDEAQGVIAYDYAGTCDGTLLGDPVWQPTGGMVDGALQFDGVDDSIISSSIPNSIEGPFSVFAWVKGGAPGQVVISQRGGVNWLCADTSEGSLMTELMGTGRDVNILPSQAVITDGNWHRIGLVWNGYHRQLYVDDLAVAEDTRGNLEVSSSGLYIGTGKAMEPGTFWSGLIDDVRIYDRAVNP